MKQPHQSKTSFEIEQLLNFNLSKQDTDTGVTYNFLNLKNYR
jgi:hypothetical protein